MRSTILLTGASGVIGRAVAEELADEHVIGLVHSDTDVPEVDEALRADTAQPRLGLSESDWKDLAARVDVVIHSAALTEWGQPWQRYQSINIDGTERVVELARAAGAPIHYVSTCFVRAIELGNVAWLGPDNVVAPYIRSKLECERLVRESGLPFAIYRPTNLVGDSRTGGSSRPQIVQLLSEWLCRGKAPYYPSHPGNLVDVLSLDMTAIAIARIVRAGEFGGRYWLTTGPDAMTVQDAQEILFDARPRHRPRPRPGARGRPVPAASRTAGAGARDIEGVPEGPDRRQRGGARVRWRAADLAARAARPARAARGVRPRRLPVEPEVLGRATRRYSMK